jgi:hypothetical protein
MVQELYYTSAERGLQLGSTGYCTVARTGGMSRALQARLEELSSYRTLFAAEDAHSAHNPVVFSHSRVTADGQTYSVLSRIAPSTRDYSGRGVYFAHHVVVAGSERPRAGPADLALQPSVFANKWDGEVRELAAGRSLPNGELPIGVCQSWKRLTGDAGWAGVVAEHLTTNPTPPFYFIYDAGTDVLPLIREVLSLLPPERRWDVTYTTYFTAIDGKGQFTLRGVVRGTKEASIARNGPHLDLATLDDRRPPETPYVNAARSGQPVCTFAVASSGPAALYPNVPGTFLPRATGDVLASIAASPMEFSTEPLPTRAPPRRSWLWIVIGGASLAALLFVLVAITVVAVSKLPATHVAENPKPTSNENKPASPEPPTSSDKLTTHKPPDEPTGAGQVEAKLPSKNVTAEELESVKKELETKRAECELKDKQLQSKDKQLEQDQAEIRDLKKQAEDHKKFKNPEVVWSPAGKLDSGLSLSNEKQVVRLPKDMTIEKLVLRLKPKHLPDAQPAAYLPKVVDELKIGELIGRLQIELRSTEGKQKWNVDFRIEPTREGPRIARHGSELPKEVRSYLVQNYTLEITNASCVCYMCELTE